MVNIIPMAPDGAKFSPEFRLLMACSWEAPVALEQLQAGQIVAICESRIDWEQFVRLVILHGVQPQAYVSLTRYAKGYIPKEVAEQLRALHVQVSVRALSQAAELVRLQKKFASEGIPLLPLKGVALSLKLYNDPGRRSSCDLDILIRPEHTEQVTRFLEAEGYRTALSGRQLTRKQQEYIRRNLYHLEFIHDDRHLHLELHWKFGAVWQSKQMNLAWNSCSPLQLMGISINQLTPEFLLLMLSDHGARHRFFCLKWLGDIARLLSTDRALAWGELLPLAETLDLERTLALAVLLAHWVYGMPIPVELQPLITHDATAVRMSRKVFLLLHQGDCDSTSLAKRLGGAWLSWQIKRLRPAVPLRDVLQTTLIAPSDFAIVPLPDMLFWLYCPLRPLLWLRRYYRKPH